MKCVYNQDEFYTNTQGPVCNDCCPVPEMDGMCKYEDRQEVRWVLTPKGCLIAALNNNDVHIEDSRLNAAWEDFVALMLRYGYLEEYNEWNE